MRGENSQPKSKSSAWIWAGLIALIIVTSVCWFGWQFHLPSEGPFTLINVLFSGLAFVGVIIAIFMQREELELQRNELAETRAEFKEQNKTLRKQRFENSFFQLLAVHNQRASAFSYSSQTGATAFTRLLVDIKTRSEGKSDLIPKTYHTIKGEGHIDDYVVYSTNLFNILQMIQITGLIDDKEKAFYFRILSCQLSTGELNLAEIEARDNLNNRPTVSYLHDCGFFNNLEEPPYLGPSNVITGSY
jgi:uncharacterized membrane protein